jgi:predicted aspartyl protease
VNTRFEYDARLDPPAPVLPVRIAPPGEAEGVLLLALIDSGADITVIPESVTAQADLPVTGNVRVRGVGGSPRRLLVHAAALEGAGEIQVVEVVGFGDETLLGRNVLNLWTLTLHGPEQELEVVGSNG